MRAAAPISSRVGRGAARGTCGELAQGVLAGGRPFHVTCPIEEGAAMTVTVTPSAVTRIAGLPVWATATARALRQTAELLELGPVAIEVERRSALARAKGMASSTADVVAAARALAAATGHDLGPNALAQLATSIEASDGVMYDGVVALDQRDGTLLHDWPWSPDFTIAMFVPETQRITADVRFDGQHELARVYAVLLEQFDAAMQARDAVAVAHLATRSAELNEAFVPNPLLPGVLHGAASVDAAGVVVGHSGTVCGLLFPPGPEAAERARQATASLLPSLPSGTQASVTRMAS